MHLLYRPPPPAFSLLDAKNIILALLATSFIASSNYVINEWLDRHFDKYHPIKKNRPAVSVGLKAPIVYLEYAVFTCLGLSISFLVGRTCFITVLILWIMGLVYNVKPIRSKDIAYLDVISESLNNALRLLIGWFAVLPLVLPPSSIILGYWMGGAYLMAIKRYSEYRTIDNPEMAGRYRKSFKHYTEKTLLNSSLFYAMFSVFLIGAFLIKYHIEYIIAMPFICILYVIYFNLSFQKDSTAQAPEKLLKEKKLMIFMLFLIVQIGVLTFIKIPVLQVLMNTVLVGI
ncbi:MAG: UbiA family prenyltransferase [Candidatus Ancillula sp.]|nr:UbiA family prenyltransferase [Candidatus Ancillula sp.]